MPQRHGVEEGPGGAWDGLRNHRVYVLATGDAVGSQQGQLLELAVDQLRLAASIDVALAHERADALGQESRRTGTERQRELPSALADPALHAFARHGRELAHDAARVGHDGAELVGGLAWSRTAVDELGEGEAIARWHVPDERLQAFAARLVAQERRRLADDNVKLAAQQAAALVPDRRVAVVPTRNAAEGIAALLGMDPAKGSEENATIMLAAARCIQSLQVTDAVRDARIGGKKVKKGQTIVLDPDDGLVASGGDRHQTVLKGLATLQPGFELVSVYYGADTSLDEAEGLSQAVTGAFVGVDVELINGGQPHYHYLIAAE